MKVALNVRAEDCAIYDQRYGPLRYFHFKLNVIFTSPFNEYDFHSI